MLTINQTLTINNMNFFTKNTPKKKTYLIFLVEDNLIYAEQIKHFLITTFGEKIDIVHFPVAEVLDVKLESGNIPDIIIMDHYLSDKYPDAELGLTALKRIKKQFPKIELILHTSQNSIEFAADAIKQGICNYVEKSAMGFKKLEELITKLTPQQ